MIPHHRTFLLKVALALGVAWTVAIAGYQVAEHGRPSLEKLRRHIAGVDLAGVSGDVRRAAFDDLVARLNRLPAEDQHLARLEQPWTRWFPALPVHQREELIDDTLPADAGKLLTAFDLLPEEIQTNALSAAFKRLVADQAKIATNNAVLPADTNWLASLHAAGLGNYFDNVAVAEKVRVVPLLEELRSLMESGEITRRQFRR